MAPEIFKLATGNVHRSWEKALHSARDGKVVVVHAAAETWDELHRAGGPLVTPGPRNADPANPLVERELEPAQTHLGQDIFLASPGNIQSSGGLPTTQTALYAGKTPAALKLKTGKGALVLIAHNVEATPSSSALNLWLDNATGHTQTSTEAEQPKPTKHPSVAVVHTRHDQWSTLLAHISELDDTAILNQVAVTHAGKAGKHLPCDVYDALIEFSDVSHPSGALLIKGVPTGHIPATPEAPGAAHKDNQVSEYMLLTAARQLGQPVGYLPEHHGALVQNISPTRQGAAAQVSTSSAVTLAYHTEAAFHPHQPRHLLLLCLRGDPNAATTLCSVHALIQELTNDDIEELRKPSFTTGIDESYTRVRSTARSLPRPVLSGNPQDPKLWLDIDLMQGTTPRAQEALEKIGALTTQKGTAVTLEAGDLLIVDNHKAVHGRTPFTPRYDGTDRWLQRSMTIADHTSADGQRNGRIIATKFLVI